MKFKIFKLIFALVSQMILAGHARAALVVYEGTSTANYATGSVSAISLTWTSAPFNDSQVIGLGTEFFDVPLITLTFSPNPLGATTFTTENAAFQLHYVDGSLFALRVGGVIDGVQAINGGSDDFMVRYTPAGGAFQTAYRLSTSATLDGNSFDMTAAVTSTVVPEPSSALFMASALIGLALYRNRRK